ncbi:MAG: tetronasin resistance protein [Lachnospiraceae bacterium]|nr:tetronasin resistance protein [Lachnospiraceae bacterium]
MREEFTHWSVLFKQYMKRDWKLILFWVLGLGGFAGGFLPAFEEIGKGNGLIGLYETMKNPAMISLCGPTPVQEAAEYTVGAMYGHLMLLFTGLIAMLVAAVHVVSHTRKEEESGLTEFVCSYRVGRHASSVALLAEEIVIHVLITIFSAVLLLVFDVESVTAGPAFLFAVCVGIAGVMGAAIALVMAQIMPSSAGATGASLGMIGVLYVLRAGTDISNLDLSMWNPMGWIYLTYPFTKNRTAPLFYAAAFCVAVILIAFALERGRDMGSGYLPEKTGRGNVKKSLLSVPGLLIRLNRSMVLGWVLTFLILGAVYGSIYGDMETFLGGNELIRAMFTAGGISVEASFTSTILVVLGGLAAIVPVVVVNKLFTEESSARLGQVSATRVSRAKLYWVTMGIAVFSAALALFAAAGGLGGAALLVMEKSELEMTDFLLAGMNYLPAVLFFAALSALMLGWLPAFGKAVYIYIGYAIMLNYFQGLLDLPEWFENTAVLSWIPRMPMDEFDGMVFAVVTVLSLVIMVIGYLGYRKRDMVERI